MLSDVQDMNERHAAKRTGVVTSRLRKWGILVTPETGCRLWLCGLGLLWEEKVTRSNRVGRATVRFCTISLPRRSKISHQRRYFVFINRLRESASARENTFISSSARVSTSAP